MNRTFANPDREGPFLGFETLPASDSGDEAMMRERNMKTKFFEVVGTLNWGKFMVCEFTHEERKYRSAVQDMSLIQYTGWGREHRLIVDLQTGEGAVFPVRPSGMPAADLKKHKVWVCPMFEPFLEWLYQQDLDKLDELPALVELKDAPASWYGYRREGAG